MSEQVLHLEETQVIENTAVITNSKKLAAKLKEIRILGLSLPMYAIVAGLVIAGAYTGVLPNNMVGALAIMMVLGSLFNLLGTIIPVVRSYLGGGAVFCIFASAALATFGLIPQAVIDNCSNFMSKVGFLDFYIAALITGSILGMDRDLLKKAAVRFLPVSFLSMGAAILVCGLVGMITGRGFGESILYIALPMMSGGMGAGVVPLSGIYASALGTDSASIVSTMIPASAIGNVLAIITAAMLARLGLSKPSLSGNGKLMKMDHAEKKQKAAAKIDLANLGTGFIIASGFFILGCFINKVFPNIHAYAFMIILVVIFKVLGIVPEKCEEAAVQWSQFVMKNFTHALLAGIGIAMLDLKVLASAITPSYLLICISIILTVVLVSGLFGKLVGFYPIESSITAGLCTDSMGGTGNIAVLSASDRMELIPFAQMATRLGGAMILILASFLIRIL
jgi:malate:Na+ symporter